MTRIDTSNCNYAEAVKTALVADGVDVTSAELIRADGNRDERLIVLKLTFADGTVMDVSFLVYFDGTWYTPCDWQGWQPQYKIEAKDCQWQLGMTGRKAVILGGAPRMLFGE